MITIEKNESSKYKVRYRIVALIMAFAMMLPFISSGVESFVDMGIIEAKAYPSGFSTLTYDAYSLYTDSANNSSNSWTRKDPSSIDNYNFLILSALYGKTYSKKAGNPGEKKGNTLANDDMKMNYYHGTTSKTESSADCASFISRCVYYGGVSNYINSSASTYNVNHGDNGWYDFGINCRTNGNLYNTSDGSQGTCSGSWNTVLTQAVAFSSSAAPIQGVALKGTGATQYTDNKFGTGQKHYWYTQYNLYKLSHRIGDIFYGGTIQNESQKTILHSHSMIAVTDGSDYTCVLASSNADWQDTLKVLNYKQRFRIVRPYKCWVVKKTSASNSIVTKVDGRQGYGFGFDGSNRYSTNSQIAYFYYSQSGNRYGYQESVQTPVTTPKITDRSGNVLYCTTFVKQHPSSMSYIGSTSTYAYGDVDSVVYLNGWNNDSESLASFNSRMRSLDSSSYTDLQNQYEAYAATQLAIWKVDKSPENTKYIGSVHPWSEDNSTLNHYKNPSQRVYAAAERLAKYASNNSSTAISSVPHIDATRSDDVETVERKINGIKYLIQGPINISSEDKIGNGVPLKGVKLVSNNPAVKITQSNADSAVINASATLDLANGSSWNIYVVTKKPDKGNKLEASILLSATTVPAVVASGAKYVTYKAEYADTYLQRLFKANGSPQPASGTFPVEFRFENVYGQVSLSKVNKRGESLEGITFGIYEDQACTKLAEYYPSNTAAVITTGANGSINSDALPTSEESPVTYYVKERSMTSAQSQLYALNPTVYPVTVIHDKVNPVNNGDPIVNPWQPSRVSAFKENENGDRLSGIKFGVYTTEQCTELVKDVDDHDVTMTTDSTGLATSAPIKVNDNGQKNVYVKEISIDSKYGNSYVLNPKVYSVTLSAGQTVSLSEVVINDWNTGSFSIHKVDDDGVDLEGVIFQAYEDESCQRQAFDVNGVPIILQTDAQGRATSNQIKVNKNGTKTFYLKEMQMTDEQEKIYEYLTDTLILSVVAGYDTPYKTNVINKHIEVPVKITKTDFCDSAPVPDAEITIYNHAGVEVYRGITDSNGEILAPKLRVGQYTFKETVTPEPSATGGKGYKMNETVFEFTVNSDKSITGTTGITDEPTEVILRKIDEDSLNGVADAEITVYDKMNTVVATGKTDNEGNFKVQYLPYGTYTFKETVAPEGYVRNSNTFTFTIDRNGVVTGDSVITNKQTEYHVKKTDVSDGRPVEGAQIAVYWLPDFVNVEDYLTPELVEVSASDIVSNSDVTKKEPEYRFKDASKFISDDSIPYFVGYTDDDGDFAVFGLPVGKYVFRETAIPDNDMGYQLNPEAYAFVINEDGSIEGCTTLTEIPTVVKITKTDLTTSAPVSGAEIAIYSEDGKEVFKDITDENGEISLFYLPKGTYYFKETVAPDGYILNTETFKFVIDRFGVQVGDSNITNKHTEVKITKTDLTTSKPVPGAEITIYDKDGNEVYKDLTGEDGSVTAFRLLPGDYTFKETLAPDGTAGYQINSNTFNFTIRNDGTVEGMVDFTDEPTKVTLTKSDLTTSEKVPEAEITVYNDKNEKVFSGFTDSNGELEITYLPAGEYTFKETVAPDGYIINEAVFKFVIHPDGSVTGDTDVSDKPTEVKITKSDLTTSDGVSGAEITIYDEDGNEVYKDITDEHGNITAFRLPVGTYTFKETVAPEGYLINEAIFTFTIHKDGSVTGDDTVVDERIQGNVQIMKVDSQNKDKKLEGATFYVFDEQGMMVDTVTTDKNGIATTKLLDYGIYTFTEVNAPEGYALPEESTRVLVSEHQKTYSVTITNNEVPKTGESNFGMIVAITAIVVVLIVGTTVVVIRRKKESDAE